MCRPERTLACEQLIQQAAEGPDVGAAIYIFSTRLFRTHIWRRTDDVSHDGLQLSHGDQLGKILVFFHAANSFCQSEIEDLHSAFGRDLDVRWLEVTVNDPLAVRCLQRLGNLARIIERLLNWQRTDSLDPLRQGFAFHQLKHEAVHVVGFFEAVDRRNVGTVECCERACFPPEAGQPLRIASKFRGQGLDGYVATELAVVCAIHFAHTTGSQWRQDSVWTELAADYGPAGRESVRVGQSRCFQEAASLLLSRQH